MKSTSVFIPVLFIALLFVIVLPRLVRSQSLNVQVLPPTSSTPVDFPDAQVSVRPITASQPAQEVAAAEVAPVSTGLSGLNEFAAPYLNGQAGEVVAVSVEGRFSLPVVQQPKDQPAYVSSEQNVLTQFSLPRQYGTTGLLAHNFLSGKLFSTIQMGDLVTVVFGDGSSDQFQVNQIESYQALSPNSPYSQFIDLSDPSAEVMTSATLFNNIYAQPDRLVFQTCIASNGEPSWGRLFISASRLNLTSALPSATQFISNN